MRRLFRPAVPVLLTGSTAACVTAKATMLSPTTHAPVPEQQVAVFLREDEVPEACERIALIHTSGDASMTDETQMIAAARRRAGKVGANAVLLTNVRDPSTGTRVAAAVFGISANRKGQQIAFRCPDANPVASDTIPHGVAQ